MSTTRSNRYQEGSIDRISRAKGPDVWVYRWRELQDDGSRVQRKKTIGTVEQYPKKADVKREVENLRSEINAKAERVGKITVADAWGHFQIHELRDACANRSETTISRYLELFEKNILPEWGNVPLDEVKQFGLRSGCDHSLMRTGRGQNSEMFCVCSSTTQSGVNSTIKTY